MGQQHSLFDKSLITSLPGELTLAPHAPSPGWHVLLPLLFVSLLQLTGLAGEDAAVAQAARLQHKQQLGQQPLQLIDGPALHCSALKAALNQASPHCFQPPCTS